MKKVLMSILSLSFIASGAYLTGCSCNKDDNPPTNDPAIASAYLGLEINPSIDLVIDQYGKVFSVNAGNDDARILLYNENGIVGEVVEKAVKKITTLAKNMGYLTNNDVVGIISEGISQDKLTQIVSSITTTAQNLGLTVTTDLTGGYSLYREFDEFKSKYPNNENIQNLTISKFKLASSVCKTSNTSLEVAIELDDEDLIEKLNSNISKIELFMTEEFQKARDIAQITFEQSKLFSSDIAYIYWFNQNKTDNPSESYLGAMYALYHATGKGVDLITNTIQNNIYLKEHALTQEDINNLIALLNVSDVNDIKDSLGNVTIKSVEKYFDVYAKENQNLDLTNVKIEVDNILDQVQEDAIDSINVDRIAYLSQVESMFEKTKFIHDSLALIHESLNSDDDTKEIANQISERIEAYNSIVVTLKSFVENENIVISLEEMNTIKSELLKIANEIKTEIDDILLDEEKNQIEAIKATSLTQLSAAQHALENALNVAEINAKATLVALKLEKLS